ncbi:hypothetical protein DICPUDRAFT_30800 [Dictyostelium purpureum]|uniref:ComC supersandwich domain-containing protein n=1 Tax=Dictyostelium purpureum TaxID=5786 RepID=F0ZG21_DICPU|nr:uncharacterized protein DICPUDRAFT_30800 [Dictyostelium purpureum]EGC37080.1 hypothetical protein DICPUDRAFT_30800 [Dictyostelium purpureum]|eukprot:XP_003286361.1 hypothetical protein DICPUDRAFT_30800 [Dictyostelium purpureum]
MPASQITSNISVIELREIDIMGQVIKIHVFNQWNFSINSNTSELIYDTIIVNNNYETLVQVKLKWFDQQQEVSFANEKYRIDPATMKFSMKMSEYRFDNRFNTLELILFSSIMSVRNQSLTCSRAQFGNTTDNCNFMKLQVDNHSLYGKFIRKSIVDNHILEVINSGINTTTSENTTQSFVSIKLPHYLDYLEIDPTFSILLDYNIQYSDSDQHCYISDQTVTRSVALIVSLVIGLFSLTVLIVVFFVTMVNTSPACINVKILYLHIKFTILYFKVKK